MINDKRKNLVIVTMITIIVIILGVLGASYAYFQGSIAGNGLSNIKTIANSLDNLVFTPGSDITITANQSNFGSGSGNRSGSTTSTVTLTARNDASSTHYYRMYLLISENTFVYTNGTTPELTLTVTKNGTTVINAMDVTTTKGVIDIPTVSGGSSLKQPITASAGSTTTDTWVATVTFVNLNSNQNGNAGKGFRAVLYMDNSPMLPSEYQEVKYIVTSGTQYFNLNETANENYRFEMLFKTTGSVPTGRGIFGYYNGNSTNNFYLYVSSGSIWQFGYNSYQNIGPTFTTNTSYLVSNNQHILTINGVNYNHATVASFSTAPNELWLWNLNGGSYSGLPLYAYYFKLWNGNELIRNLVPCYRTSDSVIGMYDTVNDLFYTNAGTGTFTKGGNVT